MASRADKPNPVGALSPILTLTAVSALTAALAVTTDNLVLPLISLIALSVTLLRPRYE